MPENNPIHLRSDEVQEIMSRTPNWLIRQGISLIFLLIVLLLFMAWFIKYPDVIRGTATLTTTQPPVKLIVKSAGEVEQLMLPDNATVRKGQTIASIHSSLSREAYDFLRAEIPLIRNLSIKQSPEHYEKKETSLLFGELETHYLNLLSSLDTYREFLLHNTLSFTLKNTSQQISNQRALYQLTEKELNSANQLLQHADRQFKSDQALFDKGIISQAEFFERERAHKRTLSEIHNLEKSKIQTSIVLTDLEKQLHTAKTDFEQQQRSLLATIEQQLATIENALDAWQQSYLITSPENGRLTYLQTLSEHQFLGQGTELFAILPEKETYIAHLEIPKNGYGKVKPGQRVLLKIDNFPYQEYGQLEGKIQHIALIPNEDLYLVKVTLTHGLESTYHKHFAYTPEMSGTAEIITEDLRITDRIFNSLRNLFQ